MFLDAFIQSIVWRDPACFGELKRIDELVRIVANRSQDFSRKLLDALLMVSVLPDHPLNATYLHFLLFPLSMPRRDSVWSIFLHWEYGRGRALDRHLSWPFKLDVSQIDRSTLYLTAVTQAWFLTSSNRYLRDRATKCLVKIFADQPGLALDTIRTFRRVGDPYIFERLLGAAYGGALISWDKTSLSELADHMYRLFFRKRRPAPYLMMREYARSIIRLAASRRVLPKTIRSERTIPPYKPWPFAPAPTEAEAEKKFHKDEYLSLWGSVASFGDFNRYVLESAVGRFTSYRLNSDPVAQSALDMGRLQERGNRVFGKRLRAFVNQLSEEKRVAFNGFKKQGLDGFEKLLTEAEVEAFHKLIRESHVVNPKLRYDLKIAARWILNRIEQLGWSPKLFAEFDRGINYSGGREANKAERIGKKYQWIALDQLLAHLSDRYWMGSHWGEKGFTKFRSADELGRDIDPSQLLRGRSDKINEDWLPAIEYRLRACSAGQRKRWLRREDDLPEPRKFLRVAPGPDGNNYYVMNGSFQWNEKVPVDEERFNKARRQLFYSFKSVVVAERDMPALISKLKKAPDTNGLQPGEDYRSFIGEYPWYHSPEAGWTDWTTSGGVRCLSTAHNYLSEESGFDCSIDETIRARLPSPWIIERLGLQWAKKNFRFHDTRGRIAALDPYWEQPRAQSSCLLMSEGAVEKLHSRAGARILWILYGEKILLGDVGRRERRPYRQTIHAIYWLNRGEFDGLVKRTVE